MRIIRKFILVPILLATSITFVACSTSPQELKGEKVTKIEWVEAFDYITTGLSLESDSSFTLNGKELYLESNNTVNCFLTVNNNVIYLEETHSKENTLYEYADKIEEVKTYYTSNDGKDWKSKVGTLNSESIICINVQLYAEFIKTQNMPFNSESGMYEDKVTDPSGIEGDVKLKFNNKKLVMATIESEYLVAEYTFTDYGKTKIKRDKPVIVKNKLETAYDAIYSEFGNSLCYSIGDDGSYIEVDTNPFNLDDYYDATYNRILKRMNSALTLPDYVYQSMISTTALQGKQTVTVNGISVSWSYHPDRGLEAMYILA